MANTDLRYVIDIQDVDTDDLEEVEFYMDNVEQCANSAGAEVSISLLIADLGIMFVEISGYFEDVGAFQRRWESEL